MTGPDSPASPARTAEPVAPVDAAHHRIHGMLGTDCAQLVHGDRHHRITCVELQAAYAALDVDDPDLREMPWRTPEAQTAVPALARRSAPEVDAKIADLRARLGTAKNKTSMTVLSAQIDALEWALGKEGQ
jgi:hypothetical protein